MMTRPFRLARLDADLAVKGTFRDPDWMFKTGIGGMLNAGSIILWSINPFFLPLSFALISLSCGYLLKVIRYKLLSPDSQLPDWDSWLELFISGLTWLAIQFGLCLLPISTLTISALLAAATGDIKIYSIGFLPWALISFLSFCLISALVSFVTPFLMVNFAEEERVTAGFAFGKVFRRALANPKYFALTWLLSIGIMWVSVLAPILTIVGIFVIPSTIFLGQIMCATLAAQVWAAEKRA